VVRRTFLGRLAVALLAAAQASLCHSQPQAPTTENQARYYVYGAFLTHAVPEIMGERVALGPELEQQLGLAGGADRRRIYDALMSYTDGKRLSVRRATADEIGRYRPQAKRDLKAPIFAVQADDITLLVEYDMRANTIPFVGQLGAAYQAPRAAAPPAVEQRAPPPPPVAAPKPAAPPPAPVATPKPAPPPPAPVAAPKPPAPAVAVAAPKPAPAVAAPAPKAAPVAPKPQARVAAPPVEPQLRANGPCEVKPVMTEQDLVNCRVGAPIAPRVDPGPQPAARPQPRAAPQQPARGSATPCEIKPVMSEEDLIACGIRR